MANPFYFPQAFSQNPIQSFIDGKLAAQERARKERDRQIELWYRFQNLQLSRARHEAGTARLKQRAALADARARESKALAADANEAFGSYYKGTGGQTVDGTPSLPPLVAVARETERGDPFTARFGKPMRLGGPKPADVEDDLRVTYEGPGRTPGGITPDGYPEVMTYEEAQKLYGLPRGDDTANIPARRDAYFAAGGRIGGGPLARDPFAGLPGYEPDPELPRQSVASDPFAPSRRRRRYDPYNDANDEFMLNFLGDL